MSTRVVYDESLPEGCPVLMVRDLQDTRVLVGPDWSPMIAEVGLPAAIEILDRMFADLDQQDGCPAKVAHLRIAS